MKIIPVLLITLLVQGIFPVTAAGQSDPARQCFRNQKNLIAVGKK
jgi:hypothetical protein